MRNAFADELTKLAAEDDRLVLLSGDIGNRLFDPFKAQHSERFFNCGVAEANMTGVAAGMATCGLRPITYTITPFATTRCLEQIRVDICYHNVPVIIVGVGGGLSYASLGSTHHSCEDIAFLRALPNMTVICPADALEVRAALHAAIAHNGPVYMRLGKKNEPAVYESQPDLELGQGKVIRDGNDVCILATGNILPVVVEASKVLATTMKIDARVINFHTVKPLDAPLLRDVFSTFRVVVTVEEHSLIGGLGGAVAEWMADTNSNGSRLLRFGTPDAFLHEAGSQGYLRSVCGLTSVKLADGIAHELRVVQGTNS